jgi:hypothetical protein
LLYSYRIWIVCQGGMYHCATLQSFPFSMSFV